MTSSPSSSRSEDNSARAHHATTSKYLADGPELVKEGLRQSIIAKRRARGEKQLKISYAEPQVLELTPAEVEKKERRREQNRRAAQRCRNKKRLSQKVVVQNYEKVVAMNLELQRELDKVRYELKMMRETVTRGSLSSPSFANVKFESSDSIKTETLTDEEFQDSVEDSFPIIPDIPFLCQENTPAAITQSLSGLTSADDVPYGQAQSPSRAQSLSKETFLPLYQQNPDNVVQAEMSFLQPIESQQTIEDINQQHPPWQYSPSSFSSAACTFSESALLKSKQNQGQRSLSHRKYDSIQLPPEQAVCKQSALGHNFAQQYRPHITTQNPKAPPTAHVNAQNHFYLDQCQQLLQSQNSPSQVVPSLRSPRPNCAIPRTICSQDITRLRSMSGGSAPETSRSCTEEKAFSSVSSDGSLYVDNQVSMFQDLRTVEVPDMDTDDVFLNAPAGEGASLNGHDVNNNTDIMPDNNRATDNELLQFLINDLISPTTEIADPNRGSVSRARNNVETDDVIDLMQISSDDLHFFLDSSEPSNDLLSSLVADTHRVEY